MTKYGRNQRACLPLFFGSVFPARSASPISLLIAASSKSSRGIVFHNVDKTLYSAVTLFVMSAVLDALIYGCNDSGRPPLDHGNGAGGKDAAPELAGAEHGQQEAVAAGCADRQQEGGAGRKQAEPESYKHRGQVPQTQAMRQQTHAQAAQNGRRTHGAFCSAVVFRREPQRCPGGCMIWSM